MPSYGYIRTSRDQEPGYPGSGPQVQRRQLVEAGVDHAMIYADVAASGAKDYNSRDQWHVLDQQLAQGDVLVVAAIDRLVRSSLETLAEVTPAEAAQEGAQGERRLDHAAQHPGGSSGSQHVGVVDAVPAVQRGGHQGRQVVPGVGPARRITQVHVSVRQFPQTQSQGGSQHQPGIGHQAVIAEGDTDAVGVLAW